MRAPGWTSCVLAAGIVAVGSVSAAPPAAHRVVIEQLAYSAAETTAVVGETIEWVNNDAFVHTATAKNKSFNVVIAPHKSARLVVKKAGTFEYYCRFHPNMTARLVVTAKPPK